MKVTVFASSSSRTSSSFLEVAFSLGALLAERGHVCVNGGGNEGCMGALNKGVRSKEGKIIGVIHEKFIVDGGEDALISHMVTTQGTDLTLRKQLLLDHGKGILVLPGGVGTLDELWDAVCGKSLGMKGMASKPICVVNSDGYFDGSIMQLQRAAKEGMCYFTDLDDYFHVEETAEGALNWVEKKIKCTQPLVDDDINCSGETEVVVPVLDRFKIREV